jgi:hypothetical protein
MYFALSGIVIIGIASVLHVVRLVEDGIVL